MIRLVSICLFAVALSCQSEIRLPEKPEELIPLPKMHSILADISTLESCIDGEYGQMSKYYKVVNASVENYLMDASIDTAVFRSSLDYYHGHHSIGQKMYQDVIDTLSKRFSKLKSSLPDLEIEELD